MDEIILANENNIQDQSNDHGNAKKRKCRLRILKMIVIVSMTIGTMAIITTLIRNGSFSIFDQSNIETKTTDMLTIVTSQNLTQTTTSKINPKCESLTFASAYVYETLINPSSIGIGDFNGDKNMDITISSLNENKLDILLGYGNGTFQSQKYHLMNDIAYFVTTDDFNNDNQTDLIIVHNENNNVGISIGYGNGTFQNEILFTACTDSPLVNVIDYPLSIAIADFNNDNHRDFLVPCKLIDRVKLIMIGSQITYLSSQDYVTAHGPTSIVVANFNDDNLTDFAVTNYYSNSISVFIAIDNTNFVLTNSFPTEHKPNGLAVGDFNGDNIMDIVTVSCQSLSLSVLIGYGNGYFEKQKIHSTIGCSYSISVGDLNGDTYLDIVIENRNSSVTIYLGYGNGDFQSPLEISTSYLPTFVTLNDFNNDGRLDIITAHYHGYLNLFLNEC